jgi:hypothetical protein
MIRPTTKSKQRDFINTLIDQIDHGMTRAEILRWLRILRSELRNRKPVKRGDVAAQPVTPRVRVQVIRMYHRDRRITNQHIADKLNLNAGRVSEILAGKRR